MSAEGPTQAEVDYFIRESKYIQTLPEVAEGEREYRVRAQVFRAANPGRPTGMVIMATAKRSPPGVPRSRHVHVRAVLDEIKTIFRNRRIQSEKTLRSKESFKNMISMSTWHRMESQASR